MLNGFRFRCYPTPAQEQILLRWVGCQRFIYNAKVGEDRYFRTFARKSLSHAGQYAPQDQQYSHFITDDTVWLKDVPSQVLRNGAVRWKQAYGRFFKKLAKRPTMHKKTGAQSVWLTSELFEFQPVVDPETGEVTYRLLVGTKKHPVGELAYVAHRAHLPPASIRLTIEAGRWYLSFALDDDIVLPSKQETADWLATLTEAELLERAVGVDRGVAVPAMTHAGQAFGPSEGQCQRIAKKQAAARRWQRKLSRRAKGGSNRRKAAKRIAALRQYEKNVRLDFAHQTSHALVAEPSTLLIVFEALGVQRMTAKPRAKQDPETGKWLRNGAAAKAGLNKAILASAWGKVKEFTSYKAHRAGKLVIEVVPHHTSQECSACGHIHPDNRLSQAEFVCLSCGHQENADSNAGKNIRQRGVDLILSGNYREKEGKRTMRMRKKTKLGTVCSASETRDGASLAVGANGPGFKQDTLGAECSEVTLGETQVRREGGFAALAHASGNQETPATSLRL